MSPPSRGLHFHSCRFSPPAIRRVDRIDGLPSSHRPTPAPPPSNARTRVTAPIPQTLTPPRLGPNIINQLLGKYSGLRAVTRGRGLLWSALVGSCLVHAALLGMLGRYGLEPSLADSDAGTDVSQSTLDLPPLAPPTPPTPPTPQTPSPPAPQPTPDPLPKPAPEPITSEPITSEPPAPAQPPPVQTQTSITSEFFAPQPEHNQTTPLTTPVAPEVKPDISVQNTQRNSSEQNKMPDSAASVARSAPVSIAGVTVKRAQRVTYAVDISGPMTTSIEYVKGELLASIGRLTPGQSFRIALFHQPPGSAAPVVIWFDDASAFTPVTDPARQRAAAWITQNALPLGRSVPLAGLRAALTHNISNAGEDLLFFMTRSIVRSGSAWGVGNDATLQELEQLNPKDYSGRRPVVIKALQFIDPDPTGLLQSIGALHGDGEGSYKVIQPR
jgi:outer membrane biosynthesis protein TonB